MRKSLNIITLALLMAASGTAAFADEAAAKRSGVVNINTAEVRRSSSLLPRVGEKAAQRIIEYRTEHGPFKKTTDLMQVKGFGAKTFEGLVALHRASKARPRSRRRSSARASPARNPEKPTNTASE